MTDGGNGWHRGKKERLHEPRVWATLTALADSRKVWMKKEMSAWVKMSSEGFLVYPRFHSPSTRGILTQRSPHVRPWRPQAGQSALLEDHMQ